MKQGELFAGPDPRPPAKRGAAAQRASKAPRRVPPDAEHRRRAVTLFDRPILLEAGAGTGKTATLVARAVQWCLGPGWDEAAARAGAGSAPEPIAVAVLRGVAAITFTEAAAAEMSTRVGKALAHVQRVAATGDVGAESMPAGLATDALPADPALLYERARALRAALDHLQVSTIHAFCRRLLAAHPLAVDLDPAFELDATFAEVEIVAREVLEAWLREAWSEPVDEDLIALARQGVDPPKIERAVIDLVEDGARAADFEADPLDDATRAGLRSELEQSLAALAPLGLEVLARAPQNQLVHDALAALAETAVLLDRLRESGRTAFAELCAGMRAAWSERAGKKLKEWASTGPNKTEHKLLGSRAAELAALGPRLAAAVEPLRELDPELLERARKVVHHVLAGVEAELRRRGVATFADLLIEADRLLREHPAIAARERGRLRQLLVDEFQDTDALQCEIVGALGLAGGPSERPALFVVGDPKQSIFAWRNADLGAYDAFKGRVLAAGGETLALTCNFRSRGAVLDEVERALAHVMEERHGVQPAFVHLDAGREDAAAPAAGPVIEYWVSWPRNPGTGTIDARIGRRKGASYEAEARALALDVAERRNAAGSAWKDFAVLFRSFTEIEPYLQELRERGVPYEVQSDRKYYQRREVVDATALVRAVLDPNDQLALVTFLRSPMVGTPDAALLPLWEEGFPGAMARLRGEHEKNLAKLAEIVRAAAGRVPASIPGLDRIAGWDHSLAAAVHAIAVLRRSFREDPADRWIERLRALVLPDAVEAARFLGGYRLANLERFFRDLLRALEQRAGDAQSVLRTLRANLARDDRSEASRPSDSGQDAVQILTIHGAKGLEFRHLYLAQSHKEDGGRDVDTAFDRRGEHAGYKLFGSPSPAWFEIGRRRKEAEAAERVRLLYVALTRAKDRLCVLGGWSTDPKRKAWRDAATFQDLFEHRAHAEEAVAVLAERAARGDLEPWTDEAGALWRLASAADDEAPRVPEERTSFLPEAQAREESRTLAAARETARARMQRPFSTRASEEAHAEGAEARALRRFAEDAPEAEPAAARSRPATPISRAAAQAAGTTVHRVLELFDLSAERDAELARWIEQIDALAREHASEEDAPDTAVRARELLQRVAANGLLDRLIALREHVIARELPVLLPPSADGAEDPVGFVSGAIDLVYRDPASSELVVVDFKTDDVEDEASIRERAALYRPQGAAYVEALRSALELSIAPRFEFWFLHTGHVQCDVGKA